MPINNYLTKNKKKATIIIIINNNMNNLVGTLQKYLPKSEPLRSIATTAVIGVAALVTAKITFRIVDAVKSVKRSAAATKRLAAQKKDTVYIFGFPKTKSGEQFSTPCDRVEMYCKLMKIPYECVATMDTSISNTERLPCIELNGEQINDSKFIIDHLEAHFDKAPKDRTREDESTITALLSLVEDIRWHHYRAVMIDHPDYTIDVYASFIGYPRFVVEKYVRSMRKSLIKTYNQAGNGDLSDVQYNQQFLEDLKALEWFLSKNGSGKFILGGDSVTKADCLIAPSVKNVCRPEKLAPLVPAYAFACSSATFKDYLDRVEKAVAAN